MEKLVNYSSSSSESDNEEISVIVEPNRKVAKLSEEQKPLLPKAIKQLGVHKALVEEPEHNDPAKHGGRIRSFIHERGNWATYVYIPVDISILEDAQELCQKALLDIVDLEYSIDLHISLSRTVVLQYHLIDSFAKSLADKFEVCTSFSASLRHLKIYTNEEKTRTFIAFKIEALYFEKMRKLLSKVDEVMYEYKLEQFYKDPSFHVSFLWCTGDKVAELHANLSKLVSAVKALNEYETFNLLINEIHCKCGNKDFTFNLK